MAKLRDYYFKRESSVNDSDTVIIDINVKDPISYITIEYEATNGSTSCLDHELHDDVTKIELVDGSNVIFSTDMKELIGLNFFELGKLPHAKLSEVGGETQEESCIMHFGRYPDDLEYYLDPTKFKNLQLRLTHSLTISSTAGFATGTGKITVKARLIEEGAKPQKGYIFAKEKRYWTTASSGDETTDLPTDYPYRMLFGQFLLSTYRPDEIVSKWKLSCDADAYVPFNMYLEDVMDLNQRRLGYAQQFKKLLTADDGTALLDIYDIRKAHITSLADDHIATIEAIDAEKVSVGLYDFTSPATPAFQTSAKNCLVDVEGVCPQAMVCHYFGDQNDPDSWLDAKLFKDIKLYCTQATANASAKIVLVQVAPPQV